jgi:hypothetical protein
MTYDTQIAADQQQQEAAARDQRNAEAWEAILRTFPMNNPGIAHFNMLVEYCQGELTLEKVGRFFANPPKGWSLPLIALDKRRQQIVDEIIELEADPTGRRMSDYQLRQNKIKYESTYGLAQLRARYVELCLLREWSKKSVPEIQTELAALRATQAGPNPWFPFEKLPAVIEGMPAAEYLRYAAKHEFNRFKRLVEHHGSAQITAAMQSR